MFIGVNFFFFGGGRLGRGRRMVSQSVAFYLTFGGTPAHLSLKSTDKNKFFFFWFLGFRFVVLTFCFWLQSSDFVSFFLKLFFFCQKQPPETFYEKGCSQKFHKIHRKIPVPESLFNKIAGLRPTILLKKRLWQKRFPVNFANFLRTPF